MLKEDGRTLRKLAHECTSKKARERERLKALLALSKGRSVSEVADFFDIDEATVYRWVERWNEERDLKDKPRDGRPPVFGDKETRELHRLIEENNPKKYGLKVSMWTCAELRDYFLRKGIDVSVETLRRKLVEMKAHYVKATLVYAEADSAKQKEFAKRFAKDMRIKPRNTVVLFQDEMSAKCSARPGYGWTFKKRLVVEAPQKNRARLNCFGAVNSATGEILEMTSKNAKSDSVLLLLRKILKKYPAQKVWIYWDNGPVHKSKKVKKFAQQNPRLTLKHFPPYSPQLNPKEQWHNYIRKKLLNNRSFKSVRSLAMNIAWFTKRTPPPIIQSICSLKPIYNLL